MFLMIRTLRGNRFLVLTFGSKPRDASRKIRDLQFGVSKISKPQLISFPFLWMAVVLCFRLHFLPEPFIKIKTKQNNNNKKLSRHSLEPLGARGWENILAAITPTSIESIQGSVCLVVWKVWSAVWKGGQLVEVLWHGLGREPGLAQFQTLSFPSLKCQDLIHGKLGELAALSEDFIEPCSVQESHECRILSQKRRETSEREEPVSLQECVQIWNGLGVNMCTGVIGRKKEKEEKWPVLTNDSFEMNTTLLSAHFWILKGKKS